LERNKPLRYLSNLQNLLKQKYDIVINTIQSRLPDHYLLTLGVRAKRRLGPATWGRKGYHRLRFPFNPYRFLLTETWLETDHIYKDHFQGAVLLGMEPKKLYDYLLLFQNLLQSIAAPPLHNRPYVLLTPATTKDYKVWSGFDHLAPHLQEFLPAQYECLTLPAQPLSFEKLLSLILHARLFIANDGGLLHIAESLGTPTIGIYLLQVHPFLSRHFLDGKDRHIVFPQESKVTQPYHSLFCREKTRQQCLKLDSLISIQDVCDAAKIMLNTH